MASEGEEMNANSSIMNVKTPTPRVCTIAAGLSSSVWSKMSKKSALLCRICYDDEKGGSRLLISPCKCSGSMAAIHQACLEKWLSTSTSDLCELCGYKFNVKKTPPTFTEWLCGKSLRESDSRPTMIGDICCFLLLTPMAVLSAYLCGLGAAFYLNVKQNEAIGLITLASFLILVYLLWVGLTVRYHRIMWKKWKKKNHDVQLVEINV